MICTMSVDRSMQSLRVAPHSTALRRVLLPALLCCCATACVSNRPSPQAYAVRHIARDGAPTSQSEQLTLHAAEIELVNLGYRISRRDSIAGRIVTHPRPRDITTGGDGARTRLVRPRQGREVAEVLIERSPDGVSIYCKVTVQELATETYRLHNREARSSDLPSQTPIEYEAATTDEQNTVWRTVRRDRAKEQTILAALLDRAAAPAVDTQESASP